MSEGANVAEHSTSNMRPEPIQTEDISMLKDALDAVRMHYRSQLTSADKRIRLLEVEFLKSDEEKVYWRSRHNFLLAKSQSILKRDQLELDNRKYEISYLNTKIRRLESRLRSGYLIRASRSCASSPGNSQRKLCSSSSELLKSNGCHSQDCSQLDDSQTNGEHDEQQETKLLIKTREKQLERLAVQLDGLNSLCQQQSELIEELQQRERKHTETINSLNEGLQRQKSELESLSRKLTAKHTVADYHKFLTSSEGGNNLGGGAPPITGTSSRGLFLFRPPPPARPAITIDEAALVNFLSELRTEVNQLALLSSSGDGKVAAGVPAVKPVSQNSE